MALPFAAPTTLSTITAVPLLLKLVSLSNVSPLASRPLLKPGPGLDVPPASSGIRTFLNGPGNRYWAGGGVCTVSASWAWGTGGRIAGSASANSPCNAPDQFKYPDADGVEHILMIGGNQTIDSLQALYDAGDFDALAALE